MTDKDRNPNRRGGDLHGRIHEYFLGFIDHFHFFFRITAGQKLIDVRQTIKGNLVRVDFGVHFAKTQQLSSLFSQLIHSLFAGS